jgi:hypothetical protein
MGKDVEGKGCDFLKVNDAFLIEQGPPEYENERCSLDSMFGVGCCR